MYNERGERKFSGDPEAITDYIRAENTCLFTQSLTSDNMFHHTVYSCFDPRQKVISDRKGKPTLIRVQADHGGTRWISQGKQWGFDERTADRCLEPYSLRSIRLFLQSVGVGYKPTLGSVGVELMRKVWRDEHLSRHTALSLAGEEYVRKHSCGGIVQTPGRGKVYDELLLMDMSSAWLSQYVLHPCGTAIPFIGEPPRGLYFTYFAEVEVCIIDPLPLGPFPVRTGAVNGKRVVWPTEPGCYTAFLWREGVDDCIKAGCLVRILRGYAWREYTTDSYHWAEKCYWLRKNSPSEYIGTSCKKMAVSAVGHHAQLREHYFIVAEDRVQPGDMELVRGRDALNLYLRKEKDPYSALMVHWYYYTIAICNSLVYNFALPFAREGRLVAIDYDSILIVEKDERHKYVARKEFEALDLPPGTWLWILLHNVRVPEDRHIQSDELTKTPGVPHEEQGEVYVNV